jgi:hypothetical protein
MIGVPLAALGFILLIAIALPPILAWIFILLACLALLIGFILFLTLQA